MTEHKSNIFRSIAGVFCFMLAQFPIVASGQTAYFADGYHGGVYGHYPRWKTRYILEELHKHPEWKINLEIEPETYDSVKAYDPEAYLQFKEALEDSSLSSRIEFVNPSYGQSYLYNISGESIIRQFSLGIEKMRGHFPSVDYLTYSSEEPCFTSALPQILRSFGFKYAVLKNPNTCWGGYTRAFGGEKVNWVGPDGSSIPTVPRYEIESLQPGSTWQTIAWVNSNDYIEKCFSNNIDHPVGMCLQDAGWRGGPWLGSAWTKDIGNIYRPSEYILWRDYFNTISSSRPVASWKLSQEDMLVSLVWGSQVLQKLAQQVRASENRIVIAEKIAALHSISTQSAYPKSVFNAAWRSLLMAQHHDCWIVPYNGKPGETWADKTKAWTDFTNQKSDSIILASVPASMPSITEEGQYIHVYNTVASSRKEIVSMPFSGLNKNMEVVDDQGKTILTQITSGTSPGPKEILFLAEIPPLGSKTYRIQTRKSAPAKVKSTVTISTDNIFVVDTDLYRLEIDASKGGTIRSLKAKALKHREFVDVAHERSFNELRGFFYELNKFISSRDQPAAVTVLEDGPIRTRISIHGQIGEHPFTQYITLCKRDPKIDFKVTIDWKGNPGIGKYSQSRNFTAENPEKAFYNDQYKLLALFPVNFSTGKIYKDAPFDVTESKHQNTFFNRWDSIKHNIILHWVDLEEKSGEYGIALLTDHTTSYAFGENHPLGLTLQYSGTALWGRNYGITGPTQVRYALIPHAGKWDTADISTLSSEWNEPLTAVASSQKMQRRSNSWITMTKGWELSALQVEGDYVVLRIFNAAGNGKNGELSIDDTLKTAEEIELNGNVRKELPVFRKDGRSSIPLSMPRFGIRTLRIKIKS